MGGRGATRTLEWVLFLGAGCGSGNRDKQGSDDGNGDGGTWTLPGVSACV